MRDVIRLLREALKAEDRVDAAKARVEEELRLHSNAAGAEFLARAQGRLTQALHDAEQAAEAVMHEMLCVAYEEQDKEPDCICTRMPGRRCYVHQGA